MNDSLMKKVLLITNIPTPYRIPLFNLLAGELQGRGVALKVLFAAPGYERRKWLVDMGQARFEYSFLKPGRFKRPGAEGVLFFYGGLCAELRRERPAAVMVIGFSLATVRLWLLSFFKQMPFIIWSGSIITRGQKYSRLRRLFRRILVRRAAGFIAYGSRAKTYLQDLGAAPEKIEIAINTTDTDFYRQQAARERETLVKGAKKELLVIGYLTARKRLDLVFSAVKELSARRRDFELVLVGDGLQRPGLERLARELGIAGIVRFEGFKQKPEIPAFLARADCFLFPSGYDVWGLVLVEAMSAGLVCLSSIQAGATADLVIDGQTGFSLDFEDREAVTDRLAWVLDNPGEAQAIGQRAAQWIAENVTLADSVRGFRKALEKVI